MTKTQRPQRTWMLTPTAQEAERKFRAWSWDNPDFPDNHRPGTCPRCGGEATEIDFRPLRNPSKRFMRCQAGCGMTFIEPIDPTTIQQVTPTALGCPKCQDTNLILVSPSIDNAQLRCEGCQHTFAMINGVIIPKPADNPSEPEIEDDWLNDFGNKPLRDVIVPKPADNPSEPEIEDDWLNDFGNKPLDGEVQS